jgi:hypothetical protein
MERSGVHLRPKIRNGAKSMEHRVFYSMPYALGHTLWHWFPLNGISNDVLIGIIA